MSGSRRITARTDALRFHPMSRIVSFSSDWTLFNRKRAGLTITEFSLCCALQLRLIGKCPIPKADLGGHRKQLKKPS